VLFEQVPHWWDELRILAHDAVALGKPQQASLATNEPLVDLIELLDQRTGRLLILRRGSVAIVKEDTEIAKVAEPGAIFGELSVLLDQPHTADVRALETSQFHIANAATLLAQNLMPRVRSEEIRRRKGTSTAEHLLAATLSAR
jgi:CRP-like cAMP-binding protein